MKIVITYETADIVRLIQQNLAKQGITAAEGDIKFAKNAAVVRVEVEPGYEPPAPAATLPPAREVAEEPPPRPPTPPALTTIEGGSEAADMTDIFRASRHLEKTTEGKFPARERALIDGESYDPPEEFR